MGGGQKIFYDPDEPQKVISEYSRRNLKMLCLLTGGSSTAVTVLILAGWLVMRRRIKLKRERFGYRKSG